VWTDPSEIGLSGDPLRQLWRTAQDRLSSLPGVVGVGISNMGLLNGYTARTGSDFFTIPGQQPRPGQLLVNQKVTPGFFVTAGIQLMQGRDFNRFDTDASPPVVILNESLARFYFGGENPVGKRLDFVRQHNFPPYTVVGVVRDTRNNLREERAGAIYYPSTQNYSQGAQSMVVAVSTAGEPAALGPAVREELRHINPELPILRVDTVAEQINDVLGRERLLAGMAGFFALMAAFLACLGLYGVISYTVAWRTKEIGIRLALGAQPQVVLRDVLQNCARLTTAGVAIGIAASLALGRLISHQLFGVQAADSTTIAAAVLLILVVTSAAALIPARRASKADPMVALRHE
jgi:predicted permease